MSQPKHIVIFASGSGTNAEQIMKHFADDPEVAVSHVYSNKEGAGVLSRAANFGVPTTVFNKTGFDEITANLQSSNPDLIVLAGFLLKIPDELISSFRNKIVNIHPSLLPKYGGKGMYGHHVHQAVLENSEVKSGITIHLVDEVYDNGEILFQATCEVLPNDSIDTLASRIHELEHAHFPKVVESLLRS